MRTSINYSLAGRLASQTRRRQGATLATISTRPIRPANDKRVK